MRNLTLLTDLYQLTMMQGWYFAGKSNQKAVFDRFYRNNPYHGGYTIFAGLEHVIRYIKELSFTEEDIEYLRSLGIFKEDFLNYLLHFQFTGDMWSVPEGTVVFPGEPLLIVQANFMEAQLIETALSMFLNHESLICTKASRMRTVAPEDILMEFGLRRSHGADAGIYGARAAVIGGFDATSNVIAGKMFGIPVAGTMAHSWVMSFSSELDSFREYARQYPGNAILLVDTYNSLQSGVPNAIKAFKELMASGVKFGKYGIRFDSGDLAYLSKEARKMLDQAGLKDAVISGSNDLDEHIIRDLKMQGAKITVWGVGTKLITSEGSSSLGGVYKLAAEYDEGKIIPKMKISDNVEKITNPGIKKLFRIYQQGKIKADLITLADETIDGKHDLLLSDETHIWKKTVLSKGSYTVREMLVPIFTNGNCVYKQPSLQEIKVYAHSEMETLWDEFKRLTNPDKIKVDLSEKLVALKKQLLYEAKQEW
ncbi:MAG: putative nicotinate phosphoribosyltransferase [Firmicutes bacterium]|nr:putative nicotinate phosphoribosyltransferase [Bacillota bacterium]